MRNGISIVFFFFLKFAEPDGALRIAQKTKVSDESNELLALF